MGKAHLHELALSFWNRGLFESLPKHQENPVLASLSGLSKRIGLKMRRPYLTIDRDGWAPAV